MKALPLLALLIARPVSAGVTVSGAEVQVSIASNKGRAVFHAVESLLLPPGTKPVPKLRALLRLDNDGTRPESGLVIRFALSARIRTVDGAAGGIWTVPFLLEERHVPSLARGKGIEIPLPFNQVALADHFAALRAAGFWPDGLRMEAFIEPRRGEPVEGRLAQKAVTVDWKQPPAKAAP